MENNNYNPSCSLMSVSIESLPMSEPDSPESSCSFIFNEDKWQMPLNEDDLNTRASNPKGPPALLSLFLDQVEILYL